MSATPRIQSMPKQPPHSIEAEQSVLGALMLSGSIIDQVMPVLRPEYFYRSDHRVIYEIIVKMVAFRRPIDFLTVTEGLRDLGKLEEAGGASYIGVLASETYSLANARSYAELVKERYVLRQLIAAGCDIGDLGYHTEGRSNSELIDRADQYLSELRDTQKGDGRDLQPLGVFLTATEASLEKASKNGGAISGISTGFVEFDKKTTGLHPGNFIIIAARPGMGKTSLALNIAQHVGIIEEQAVAIFTMEMSGEEIAQRLLASMARIPLTSMRTGQLEDEDWSRLTKATATLHAAPIHVDETGSLTPAAMRAKARMIHRKTPLRLIVVDYLQLMQVPGSENRTNEISEVSRSTKSLAKELGCTIIGLAQINRSVESRPDKRPRLADLRESGSLEQDADLVAFIYRDEVYDPASKDKGTAELAIAKQRNGPTGHVRLAFQGQYTMFDNLAHGWKQDDMYDGQPAPAKPKGRGVRTAAPPPHSEPPEQRT